MMSIGIGVFGTAESLSHRWGIPTQEIQMKQRCFAVSDEVIAIARDVLAFGDEGTSYRTHSKGSYGARRHNASSHLMKYQRDRYDAISIGPIEMALQEFASDRIRSERILRATYINKEEGCYLRSSSSLYDL